MAGVSKQPILELATCQFVDRPQDVVIAGPIGTGKSHLAVALGLEAAKCRFRVQFVKVADLVRQLLEARDDRELESSTATAAPGEPVDHRRAWVRPVPSGQRFASGVLQSPPRDGHPCLPLTVTPVRPVEDLQSFVNAHLPVKAHAGRTIGEGASSRPPPPTRPYVRFRIRRFTEPWRAVIGSPGSTFPVPAVTFDAPLALPRRFRRLPPAADSGISAILSSVSLVIEVQAPTPLRVRAFGRVEPAYYALC